MRWDRSIGSALLFGALGLVAGYSACGDSETEQVDVQQWELRDALGLGPVHLRELPEEERRELEQRLRDEALGQSDDGAFADLDLGAEEARPLPDTLTSRRSLTVLDERLTTVNREPLLIQWDVFEDDGPVGRACPLSPEDFDAAPNEEDAERASSWSLDEDFDRPLDRAAPAGPSEMGALEARLPRLARWLARCAEAAGESADHPIEVRRAEGMPSMTAWWPGARRLYVNPAVLALFDPSPEDPRTELRQQSMQSSYDLCLQDTINYCSDCNTETKVAVNNCPDPLFSGGDVVESCQSISALTNGVRRFCINAALLDRGAALEQCIRTRTDNEACFLGQPVATATELERAFEAFAETPECVTALRLCTMMTIDDPEPDPIDPPDFEPEPETPTPRTTFDDEEDDECSDDCAGALCEFGLEVGCATLASDGCSDSDGGDGCDSGEGGGCEGDTADGADACGGCEGD